jgi:hypothetical protein
MEARLLLITALGADTKNKLIGEDGVYIRAGCRKDQFVLTGLIMIAAPSRPLSATCLYCRTLLSKLGLGGKL